MPDHEWFLTNSDKTNIAQYRHSDRRRKTLTTRLLSPIWQYAASFIPITVAPNVITLAGFTCTLQVCVARAPCEKSQERERVCVHRRA